MEGGRSVYLRKQAASGEVVQAVTLTGDSYTVLRRDGGRDERYGGTTGMFQVYRWG